MELPSKNNYVLLIFDRLDIAKINDLVADDACGAISLFVGTTRNNFDGKKVISLEYEAYEQMAVKQMNNICEELRDRWSDVGNIAIHHRLGSVPVREASVVIAVSSPHRQSSLNAVTYAIEELKRRVPIWKKEQYDDNESAWKENKESPKPPKLNFGACNVQDIVSVPNNLVQIAAGGHEMLRRIQCFVEKKREEIDLNNVMDFTMQKRQPLSTSSTTEISTCARTNSRIVKQEHSKCHLRVRRVTNRIGPQTRPDYLKALDKLMSNEKNAVQVKQEPPSDTEPNELYKHDLQLPEAFNERLTNIEQHLFIPAKTNSKHIYERLKEIEKRILYLESLSPEYKHFLKDPVSKRPVQPSIAYNVAHQRPCKRKTYTVEELDTVIAQMQHAKDSDREDDKQRDEAGGD